MKRYTISDIKAIAEANGSQFFSRENMKFAGDTMKNFGVLHVGDKVFIFRKKALKKYVPLSTWEFDIVTGRLRSVLDPQT